MPSSWASIISSTVQLAAGAQETADFVRGKVTGAATEAASTGLGGVVGEVTRLLHGEPLEPSGPRPAPCDRPVPPKPPRPTRADAAGHHRDRGRHAQGEAPPCWCPAKVAPLLAVEQLRKGDEIYRKGSPARVVKVDFQVDPPSLVVCMIETGCEVGTTSAHVSLGLVSSRERLAPGVRVCIVGLKNHADFNGLLGVLVSYNDARNRWDVALNCGGLISTRPGNISVLLRPDPEEAARPEPPPPTWAEAPAAASAVGNHDESSRSEPSPAALWIEAADMFVPLGPAAGGAFGAPLAANNEPSAEVGCAVRDEALVAGLPAGGPAEALSTPAPECGSDAVVFLSSSTSECGGRMVVLPSTSTSECGGDAVLVPSSFCGEEGPARLGRADGPRTADHGGGNVEAEPFPALDYVTVVNAEWQDEDERKFFEEWTAV